MKDNQTDQFLQKIHRKINREKKKRLTVHVTALLLLMVLITYPTSGIIHKYQMNSAWAELNEIEPIPDLGELFDITQDEAVEYLVKEMDMFDVLQYVDEDLEDSEFIEKLIMEG